MAEKLGKIKDAYVGYGGYQDAMLGLSIELGGDGWGVAAPFFGAWSGDPSKYCKWTQQDQIKNWGEAMLELRNHLRDAKVTKVEDLIGIPVECSFDGNLLSSWRILKEVL